MWQADEEQRGRIQVLVKAFEEEIPAAWEIPAHYSAEEALSVLWMSTKPNDYNDYRTRACVPILGNNNQVKVVEKLKAQFGSDFLDKAMSEFLMFPDAHDLPKSYWEEGCQALRLIAWYAQTIASEWITDRANDDMIHFVGERLKYLILHLEQDPFICQPKLRQDLLGDTFLASIYYFHVTECVNFLVHFKDNPIALSYLEMLLLGQWDGPVTCPKSAKITPCETTRYAVLERNILKPFTIQVLDQLCAIGWLDYERLANISHIQPRIIPKNLFELSDDRRIYNCSEQLGQLVQRLGWEIIQEWDTSRLIGLFSYIPTSRGVRWLFAACDRVEKLGLSAIIEKGQNDYPMKILKSLAGAQNLLENEAVDTILERLRQYSEQTLLAVLPFSEGGSHGLVWKALGWTDLQPVVSWLNSGMTQIDNGVYIDTKFDRDFIFNLLKSSDVNRLQILIKQWKSSKIEPNNLIYLEAVAGWNKDSLTSSIEKYHKQAAIAAYGLLPLEGGENELLERYLFFKQVAKDCSKYGAERQANTRAFVQAGLANFAQTAGYPDMARMEWDMEAKVTDDGAPLNQLETIGDWQVELILAGLSPQINVYKQNKPLKSAPAGIKKLARYLEFKETQTRMKAQIPRFRASLEKLMTDGDTLSVDDLKKLSQLPVMKQLLQSVILRTEDGQYGLFNPQELHLVGLDNQKIAVTGPVLVPHPYHLFQDGVLSDWQREVVRKRVVQPFKQAFRELYVLTPAEEQTAVFSNRFAGHVLKPTVAGSLLQNRGWKPVRGDYSVVSKFFKKAALSAEFVFPDAESYLGGLEEITSDQIRFVSKSQPVLLKDVPPLIFSEAMRDADLVVSVAQLHEGDGHWSAESYQRRVELVNEIINDLGLKGVSCEGHFAYIQGKLANYRVHLGSAAIHIQPGNYLCIVYARDPNKNQQAFFLPIADAEPKTSEVISKILLLVNDNKIKDQSILSQINAAQTA